MRGADRRLVPWVGAVALSNYEHLAFPGQPESEQHGRLVMQWVRQPDGSWQIERYFRVPLPAPQP